jgi:hypothetical protein
LAIAVSEREELRQLRKENADLRTDPASAGFNRCFDKVAGVPNGSVERDVSTRKPRARLGLNESHQAGAAREPPSM